MKHLLYTLILVATLLSMSGCGAERAVRKGDKHQALGEYYDAAVQYRKAYRQLSPKEREQRGKVALKMARCYERINQSQRASSAYANALRYGQAGLEDRLAYGRQLLKSTCSYAMYLAHIMILNAFHDLYDGTAPVAALVPMIALSTTATTYAAVWCLGRLPWSRYWLGID